MAIRFSLLFPDEGVREYSVWNPPYGVLTDEETEIEIPQTPDSPFPATLSGLSFSSELVYRRETEDVIVESFHGRITANSPTIEMTGEHAGLSSRIYSMSRTDLTKTGSTKTTFRFVGDGNPLEFPYMYYEYTTRKDNPETHYLWTDEVAFEINALAFDTASEILQNIPAVLIEDFHNTKTWTADIEVFGEGSASLSDEAMPYGVSARWKDANIIAEGDDAFPWPENWKIENRQIGLNPDKDGNDTFTLSAMESWRLLSVKIVDLAIEPKVYDAITFRPIPEMQTGIMEACPYDCIVPNGENIQYSPLRTVVFFVFGDPGGYGEVTYPYSLHPYTNRMIYGSPAIIPTIPIAPPYVFTDSITSFNLDNPEQFIPKFATGGGSRELHKYYMACTTAFLGSATMVAILAVTKNMPIPANPEPSDLSDFLFPIVWQGPRYFPEYGRWFTQNYTIGEYDIGIDRLSAGEGVRDDAFALWWIRDCGNGKSVKTYICCFNDSGMFTHACDAYRDEPNSPSDEVYSEVITFNGEHPTTSTVMIDPGMGNLLSFLTELCNRFKSAETKKKRAEIMSQYEAAIKDVFFALSLQRPNIPKKIENWVVPEGEFDQFPVAHNKFDIMELENFRFYEQPGQEEEGYTLVPYFQEPIRPDDPFPGTIHRKWLSQYKSASDVAFAIFIVSYHKNTNQLIRNNTDKPIKPEQHGKHLLRNNTERDILEFLDGDTRKFGKDAIYRKG